MPNDPALAWLLENDPDAVGVSRREYSKRTGILTPQVESEIREHEITFSDLDVLEVGTHCRCCVGKATVRNNTVE